MKTTIKKIKLVLLEAYKKKSFFPFIEAFNILVYSLFKLHSLKLAVKEQKLNSLISQLEGIAGNYFNHYSHVNIEGDYWNFKVRALHSFQVDFTKKAIELIKKELQKNNLTLVDIGDSSGNHTIYLKKLIQDIELKILSVNLDSKAVEKINNKGLKAILSKAEDLGKYNINPDMFISYQTIEHLNSPITFLKSISQNSSCQFFLMTLPYRSQSRVALEHIRNNKQEKVHAENIHIFELSPEDWKLIFNHSGWEVLKEQYFFQYPKKHPLRILKKSWAKYDFEGFYGVILKKNLVWTEKYLDW